MKFLKVDGEEDDSILTNKNIVNSISDDLQKIHALIESLNVKGLFI